MALNYIWIAFFLIAFVVALIKLIFFQDYEIFSALVEASFEWAKLGFELSLYMTGAMSLWLGLMKIGEEGGMVRILSRLIGPFFSKLFPEIPREHPATGSIIMNFSANILGLDNAATPIGLRAMNQMQELNKTPDTASNAQIMFLVLNTSGLSVIPLTVMIDRAVMGANNPSDIFLPILLATFCSTIVGLITVSIYQRINLLDKTILSYLIGFTVPLGLLVYYFTTIPQSQLQIISNVASNLIIFSFMISFILLGIRARINIYETFVEGAKEGFQIAVKIIPFLIAILVGVGIFKASGAFDILKDGIRVIVDYLGINSDFVDALPTALAKPLSGGTARGMMMEAMETYGADSFTGRLSSILRGATETTFYILAVYFGSVNIKKTRYALTAGLIADTAGIIAAILFGYMFFH